MRNELITKMNQNKTKRLAVLCSAVLVSSCLIGCGAQTDDTTPSSGMMVSSDSATSSGSEEPSASSGADIESLLQTGAINEDDLVWAGSQYVNGEAVTVLRGANGSEDFSKAQDIYVKDGNGFLVKVADGAPGEFSEEWYYTPEGYCYALFQNKLARVEADGSVTYQVIIGADITDICRLVSGGLYVVIEENEGDFYLAKVDEATGEFSIVEGLELGRNARNYITEGEEGLLLLNSKGFFLVNQETGELTEQMPMSEYGFNLSYTIKDFRLLDGGSVEFLEREKVEVKHPKDISKYREVVTIGTRYEDEWLDAMLAGFNDSNYQYYAVQESLATETVISPDHFRYSWGADEQAKLESELANGGGVDLLEGDCISSHYIEKGYLEDLAPYLEQSGIDILDYFPIAFENGQEGAGIYRAMLTLSMSGFRIKEEVLGNRMEPSVEDLMDCLLNYSEPSVLCENWNCRGVLQFLLAGSEDLWGCVDWENKTCDFENDFFVKALEVSRLYGDEYTLLPALGEMYNHKSFYKYINEEQLELAEEVYIGYFFDDGCHPWMPGATSLSINSNSQCKDGAWAVIEYLLSEEAQTQKWLTDEDGERLEERQYPVNIYAFEAIVLLEQEETALLEYTLYGDKKTIEKAGYAPYRDMGFDKEAYRARYNLKDADVEEIRNLMYELHSRPGRPVEILGIVYEEAEKYFNEEKSVSEVCESIQEKVQSYLDAYEE